MKLQNMAMVTCNEYDPNPENHIATIENNVYSDRHSSSLDVVYVKPIAIGKHYIYSVKITYGENTENCLVTNSFNTSINIQNISKNKEKIRIRVSIFAPDDYLVTSSKKFYLEKYWTVKYGCKDIRNLLQEYSNYQYAEFIEGFLTIKSKTPLLQVTAVYEAHTFGL
jgi:predicted nuclease of restriction endonuclease-like RecB superfamily